MPSNNDNYKKNLVNFCEDNTGIRRPLGERGVGTGPQLGRTGFPN